MKVKILVPYVSDWESSRKAWIQTLLEIVEEEMGLEEMLMDTEDVMKEVKNKNFFCSCRVEDRTDQLLHTGFQSY